MNWIERFKSLTCDSQELSRVTRNPKLLKFRNVIEIVPILHHSETILEDSVSESIVFAMGSSSSKQPPEQPAPSSTSENIFQNITTPIIVLPNLFQAYE